MGTEDKNKLISENKTCSKCRTERPATTKFFPRDKKCKDGLSSWCRECHRKPNRQWREQNREKCREAGRKYSRKPEARKRQREYQHQYHNKLEGKLRGTWGGINTRVKPEFEQHKNYCDRGIKNLFENFEQFFVCVTIDMGYDAVEKLRGLEIHRIDNDKGYRPGNITFLTKGEHRAVHVDLRRAAKNKLDKLCASGSGGVLLK